MRLFVSYARVDKPYCIQVVHILDAHEVWYDQRLYAGQDWWKEIERRLDWCEGFIYLLSPDSLASEVCRKEFDQAQNQGKHIIPVLIRECSDIPEALMGVQYVDLSQGFSYEAVKILLNSIYIAERQLRRTRRNPSPTPGETPKRSASIDLSKVIHAASTAMENAQYEEAVILLKQAKDNGYGSRYINIDAILKEAELALARQMYLLEADREYSQILELVRHRNTRKLGLAAFEAFRRDFPDYDPENLVRYCAPKTPQLLLPPSTNGKNDHHEYEPEPDHTFPPAFLPLLEWCDIQAGRIDLIYKRADGQEARKEVDLTPFRIARYPVTNTQYEAFVLDEAGYANPGWWQFSPDAYNWRVKNPFKQPSQFKGDERPREMVCWYDALAFCNWLSSCLGVRISLPTTAQWQYALQGDDERVYPWGNRFEKSLCNTAESEIKMTTQVNRYPDGRSPYGVFDMIGNVWEWCIDTRPDANHRWNIVERQKRVIRGGSYMSAEPRVHTYSYYDLDPQSYHGSIGFRVVQNF